MTLESDNDRARMECPILYHSTLYVHGPKIYGEICQTIIDAVFAPYLQGWTWHDVKLQGPRTSTPSPAIAWVRIVTEDPPAERLAQELSSIWPQLVFEIAKNDAHGAVYESISYKAGHTAGPVVVDPESPAEATAVGREATTTPPTTSPERGPGTAGLLRVAVQHLERKEQYGRADCLAEVMGEAPNQSKIYLAIKHTQCHEIICDLLDSENRIYFHRLEENYGTHGTKFWREQREADALQDSLDSLQEPVLIKARDHEGHESIGKAIKAITPYLERLHLALRDLAIGMVGPDGA